MAISTKAPRNRCGDLLRRSCEAGTFPPWRELRGGECTQLCLSDRLGLGADHIIREKQPSHGIVYFIGRSSGRSALQTVRDVGWR